MPRMPNIPGVLPFPSDSTPSAGQVPTDQSLAARIFTGRTRASQIPAGRPLAASTFTGLLLAGLALGGCSDSGTGPEVPDIVFPLEIGNTWTYAPENPLLADPLQWEVTARNADTVTLSRAQGDAYVGPLTLIDGQDVIDIILGEEPPQSLYQFHVGASWIRHDPWECDDQSQWAAVREDEPIETPAGTFHNTIRLERRSTAACTDAGTMFEWWAPGVGLVRWEELNYWNEGVLVFELAEYSQGF